MLILNKDIRICFIGDSLVNGACDETTLGWTGRVCANANNNGNRFTYYNLGIRGNTSSDILNRWKHECFDRLPDTCDARVVFSCGINDTVFLDGKTRLTIEESISNIKFLLDEASKYKLILVGPPPVIDNEQNKRIELLSDRYRSEAEKQIVPFIDLFHPLIEDQAYLQDISKNDECYPPGYHPTSIGYSKISEIVCRSKNWWYPSP